MITLLALQTKLFENVHLIYSTERLKEKDKKDFANMFEITDMAPQIHYHIKLGFKAGAKDLLIFDEGDEFIYQNSQTAYNFMKKLTCIMLTATINGG